MPGDSQIHKIQLKIEDFIPGTTNYKRWIQRLEGAFTISGITGEERVPFLLHYLGSAAYEIMCNNYDITKNVYTEKYEDLTKKAEALFEPIVLEIAENFKFNCRRRRYTGLRNSVK